MKNKDKLMDVILSIAQSENKSPEVVVSELNNMSDDEINNKISKMKLFEKGGKLDYLICLKKGGSIKNCGCVEKAQNGQILMHQDGATLSRRDARKLSTLKGMDRSQFAQTYRTAKNTLREYGPENISNADVRQAARLAFDTPPADNIIAPVAVPAAAMNAPTLVVSQKPTRPLPTAPHTSQTSSMMDNLSFDDAFAMSRAGGLDTFTWRGKQYNTSLKPASNRGPNAVDIRLAEMRSTNDLTRRLAESPNLGDKIKSGIISRINYIE